MEPRLEAAAKTLGSKARVVSVDSDQARYALQQLEVSSLPTFLIFNRQGQEVERKIGMTTEANLIDMVEDAETEVNETHEYVWTEAGVEYLQSNDFHAALKS